MPDYDQQHRLGSGAFGEVWLAIDRALGAERAVKFIRSDKIKDPTNFYSEPQTLKALQHPNIVAVEDAGPTRDGGIYVAMEYISEGSLEDQFKGGVVPLREAIRIICDACRGVEHAHDMGYIHRDIKPANILLPANGSAKLSDFGLATRVSEVGTASGYGYIAHLAPEIILKEETSIATDIYAVGITLYRLVNGDAYLPVLKKGEDVEDLILDGKFPNRNRWRDCLPTQVKKIINKAINIDPLNRFQSAAELRHALEAVEVSCEWIEKPISEGTRWNGLAGDMEFVVRKTTSSSGLHRFTVKKGRAGKSKRTSKEDCLVTRNKAEMDRHTRKTLSRITKAGR
ncbi:serine/threonine protein kinase [bacterium SCSIO 12827]|nr:serine/threonine protein kinase [bacterium SCSIO 12827]